MCCVPHAFVVRYSPLCAVQEALLVCNQRVETGHVLMHNPVMRRPVQAQPDAVRRLLEKSGWLATGWAACKWFVSPVTTRLEPLPSGCNLANQASSWGKVDITKEQMVFAEATSVLPLIASDAYHRKKWEQREKRNFSKIFN